MCSLQALALLSGCDAWVDEAKCAKAFGTQQSMVVAALVLVVCKAWPGAVN
jgi:hypothetical protein